MIDFRFLLNQAAEYPAAGAKPAGVTESDPMEHSVSNERTMLLNCADTSLCSQLDFTIGLKEKAVIKTYEN